MIKYFIGTLFGSLVGFACAFLLIKSRKKESEKGVETNVGSYFRQIGELHVYRAYMKEIVTSVDHVWGDVGKKYFSWMLSRQKLAMVFEFEVDFIYDLQSPDFKIIKLQDGYNISMPKCNYDVRIKDFYFYDEQGTRLKLLPEIFSVAISGGVSEEKKNELKDMAINQIKSISREVAENLQSEAHNSTKETITHILIGRDIRLKHIAFHETKIVDDQIILENPKLIENKIS